jgi:transcriptional regulator with XRE-family HTH domain
MKFEKNLVLLRKKNNLSQEDLALSIGVSRQTIYAWESGLNYPNILMLKKLAYTLDASTDDLLNGYDVDKLPKKIENLELKFISKRSEIIKYREVPNWFISLSEGNEVNWGMYDNSIKEYSYHLTVLSKVFLHEQEGFEILVEEYDSDLNKSDTYSLILKEGNDKIYFLGKIFYQNGVKHIETFHDKKFLNQWGIEKKFDGQSTVYNKAENYELTYNSKKYETIKIAYFDSEKTKNPQRTYFEVFLDENLESLCWKRYALDLPSKNEVIVDGEKYGLEYQCVTDRLR